MYISVREVGRNVKVKPTVSYAKLALTAASEANARHRDTGRVRRRSVEWKSAERHGGMLSRAPCPARAFSLEEALARCPLPLPSGLDRGGRPGPNNQQSWIGKRREG